MRMSDWSSDVCLPILLLISHDREFLDNVSTHTLHLQGGGDPTLGRTELGHRHDAVGLVVDGGELGRAARAEEFGRASCRERVGQSVYIAVVAVSFKQKMRVHLDERRNGD